jgi:ParB/RepB/Spo0J family partition protein
MNSPIAPAAVQTSELPLADIVPSNTHIQQMRRLRFDPAMLQELCNSIKEIGVLQAVVVRPLCEPGTLDWPTGGVPTKFELVAGERRWLAAKIAGLTEIPATVRTLTDEQVLKAQLVENLQREGLHPLEEAEGYDELMKLEGITADQVGTMIGKSRSYVFARLKLLGLDLDGRKAFYAGEIDASRALYIARVANPKLRARALSMATEKAWDGQQFKFSVRDLRRRLTDKEFSVALRGAAFHRDDKSFFELVQTGKGKKDAEQRALPDCTSCVNRTGNCLDLFNQDDDPEICMEPACFEIKVKQHSQRIRDAAKAEGAVIIKGDDAKKIITRKNQFNGHIDLDDVCEDDAFPEPAPVRKNFATDEDYVKAEQAYDDRADNYAGRTFREILQGEALVTMLVDDPRSQKMRVMVPLKAAKEALAKKGVKLSDWRYSNKPVVRTPAQQQPQESEASKAKRLGEEEEEQRRKTAEGEFRCAVLEAVIAKYGNQLRREELIEMLEEGVSTEVYVNDKWLHLKKFFGDKFDPGQANDAQLVKFIAAATVFECIRLHASPKPLLDLARRLKIDPDKIKKDLKAAAKATEAPEKKAAKKPAAKKAKK